MTNRGNRQLKPGHTAWGQRRVAANLSLRDLAAATGINSGLLSMLERGRWLPDPDESERITDAINAALAKQGEGA